MEKESCYICGRDNISLFNVECEYGHFRKFCQFCYEEQISKINDYKRLEFKIDAIINSLSQSQKDEIKSMSRMYIEKEAFKDIY